MAEFKPTTPERKKRDLKHFFRYHLIRLHRLAEDPKAIALGSAWGIFVSFTPFLGFHLILCTIMCIIFGGSKLASWISSLIGNPVTFPFFFWADYTLGSWMMDILGIARDTTTKLSIEALSLDAVANDMSNIIVPILFGAVIMAPLAGATGYWATYKFVELTRHRRMKKMKLAREKYGNT
ncbi:MAG: DUF2062 domain-containing protein [Magnetococcales bacterium]|nr:DUF2062 domain-containing protein [Magnetococcales bacterium]